MYSLRPFIAFAAALLSATSTLASVESISGPTTVIHPGEQFDVTFFTQTYIQNNAQYYAVFGLAPGEGRSESLGTLLGTGVDLVTSGHSSTTHGAFNVSLTLPEPFNTASGDAESYTLTTAVFGTVSRWPSMPSS